jgi:hypothetical protein
MYRYQQNVIHQPVNFFNQVKENKLYEHIQQENLNVNYFIFEKFIYFSPYILANVISNTIMQFVPRSDSGRAMKQKLFAKKKLSPLTLPMVR